MKLCKNCGAEFEPVTGNQVHCSRSCRMAYKQRLRCQSRRGQRKCQARGCDNTFQRKQGRRYCDYHRKPSTRKMSMFGIPITIVEQAA